MNPKNAPLDYDALELFVGYSRLHSTADQLIWNAVASKYGTQAASALSNGRLHNLVEGQEGNILTAGGVIGAAIIGGRGGSYADAWYQATFSSAEASAQYHYATHGIPWSSVDDYTQAAQDFYAANGDLAKPWPLQTGEMGVKITTNDYFGIYTVDGQIVTFGEK